MTSGWFGGTPMAYGKFHYMNISFIMNSYSAIIHRYCSHYHVNQMYIYTYIYTPYIPILIWFLIYQKSYLWVHRVCMYLCWCTYPIYQKLSEFTHDMIAGGNNISSIRLRFALWRRCAAYMLMMKRYLDSEDALGEPEMAARDNKILKLIGGLEHEFSWLIYG